MRAVAFAILAVVSVAPAARAAARETPLIEAVQAGDTKAVRALIAQHVDVNAAAVDGMTALHQAVQRNDVAMVDLLLAAGAKARAVTRYGVEPIALASANANAAVIERLLKAGADPNVSLRDGETPLMSAARNGNTNAIKVLLAAGAAVGAKEPSLEQTALMWAAAEGNTAAIKVLVDAGAGVNEHSKAPVRRPAAARPAAAAPEVTANDDGGFGPRISSALPLKNLYPKGRDVTLGATFGGRTNTASLTPLLFAARAGHMDAVKTLLDLGAKIDEAASDGTTPLFIAIVNGHWELASYFIDRGANVNANGRGITPLHQLVVTRRLNEGHLPHPPQSGTMTSIELAKRLIAHGANVNARMTASTMGDGYRNRMNRAGATPFVLAAKGIDPEMMRLLVKAGADPKIPNVENTNAMMFAAGIAQYNPVEDAGTEEESLDAVKLCVSLGLDVNAVDDNGETALHGTAYKGFNTVAQYLVDQGAKLDVKNVLGWTPLTIANGVMYTDFVKSQRQTAALLAKLMKERGIAVQEGIDITAAGYVKDNKPTQEISIAPDPKR